jgi:hypothetical protein
MNAVGRKVVMSYGLRASVPWLFSWGYRAIVNLLMMNTGKTYWERVKMNTKRVCHGRCRAAIELVIVASCIVIAAWSHRVAGGRVESREIRPAEAPGTPGGNLSVEGEFVDVNSGNTYELTFRASEDSSTAGVGDAFLYLKGPALTACDVHAPAAEPNITPLRSVQCGGSYGMSVAVDGCLARVTLHGYVHSDHPFITYVGLTCFDLVVEKQASCCDIEITIYTPKGPIVLTGTVAGDVSMDTCSDIPPR